MDTILYDENLFTSLSININKHDTLPLVICNYHQFYSDKTNVVVRNCRGIVFDTDSKKIVALPFYRFFNVGEVPFEDQKFNWSSFYCTEKIDGSLIIVYHYNDKWMVSTRNSFDQDSIYIKEFHEMFNKWDKLNKNYTYLFEIVGPQVKVVIDYPPSIYLIGARNKETGFELMGSFLETKAQDLDVKYPLSYFLNDRESVLNKKNELEQNDRLDEGFVVTDFNCNRLKIKNRKYLRFNKFKFGNPISIRVFSELYTNGELSEILSVFPEYKSLYNKYESILLNKLAMLQNYFDFYNKIESQKEFALCIKDNEYACLLFLARRTNKSVTEVVSSDPKQVEFLINGKSYGSV